MSPEAVALGILVALAILGVIVCITEDRNESPNRRI